MNTTRHIGMIFMLTAVFTNSANAQLDVTDEIDEIRAELSTLRQEYETRIADLESRLAKAENNNATDVGPGRNTSSDSVFNPAIGVIFQGQAWEYKQQPDAIPGFPFGGEAGAFADGLAIGEAEINISANVDDKFTAWLTVPVVIEDGESGIEIEEAWLETTALPGGFSTRFGRFFSSVGYLNNKHAHSWDFADQPMAYQVFLGDQYLDDGVQLRWIAPTDLYLELGAEVFNGSRFPAAGSAHGGYGSYSVFASTGGDVGNDHSWLAGLSYLGSRSIDRPSGDEDDPLLFTGDTNTTIAHFVWKWAPNGNWKQRNLSIQAEWLRNSNDGEYTLPGLLPERFDNDQAGWYVQAVYQPFPRWRFGTRIDNLSKDDAGTAFTGSPLSTTDDDPRRYSLMVDWSNSEFSRLRLQYVHDTQSRDDWGGWGLQYILSIGAHGGHEF